MLKRITMLIVFVNIFCTGCASTIHDEIVPVVNITESETTVISKQEPKKQEIIVNHKITNNNKVNSKEHVVTVTAFAAVKSQTDKYPKLTASNLIITNKHNNHIIALSRDLAKKYKYGDKFKLITNDKTYIVEFQDLMPKKHKNKVDLLMCDTKSCKVFGKQKGKLIQIAKK